jgi:hypothetical protein
VRYLPQLDLDGGNITLLGKIEGTKRRLIIDIGSTVSLIQRGVWGEVVATSNLSSFGVTGDALDVKGEQEVIFCVNVKYVHRVWFAHYQPKPREF